MRVHNWENTPYNAVRLVWVMAHPSSQQQTNGNSN